MTNALCRLSHTQRLRTSLNATSRDVATLQQQLETESQRISEIQLALQRSPMDGGVGEGGLIEGGASEGGPREDGDANDGGPQPPASGPDEAADGMIGADDGHMPEWLTLPPQVSGQRSPSKSSLATPSRLFRNELKLSSLPSCYR